MIAALALLTLLAADMQPITTFERPEPPRTPAQAEEEERNQVTAGERSGDGATPDRMICSWQRTPGSNFRERVCRTVADRRATREVARDTINEAQRIYTDPVG